MQNQLGLKPAVLNPAGRSAVHLIQQHETVDHSLLVIQTGVMEWTRHRLNVFNLPLEIDLDLRDLDFTGPGTKGVLVVSRSADV